MTMKLYCQAGKHEWERPAQRGRPPLNCPEHAPVKAQPSGLSQAQRNSPERMAELRESKAQKAQEREQAARQAERERRAAVVADLPALEAAYVKAFEADDFNTADRLQARIIHAARLARGSAAPVFTTAPVTSTPHAPVDITELAIERMA